jgi:opacity protein-like surface antigen
MTKKLLCMGVVLLAVALAAMAADAITGKWSMEQAGRGGGPPTVSTMDLKADGAKLTGTFTRPGFGGGDPMTTPISNGKVDGNNIAFDVTMDFNGNSFTMKYEGVVSGSDMKVKITIPGFNGGDPRTIDATAKKQ